MRNKKWKSALDEMQEEKLLKVEERSFWLMYWLLFAALMLQLAVKPDLKLVAGEAVVFLVTCVYFVYRCLKNGIWNRQTTTPTRKGSALYSLCCVVILEAFYAVRAFLIGKAALTAAVAMYMLAAGAVMFAGFYAVFEVFRSVYKKKQEKLEDVTEE